MVVRNKKSPDNFIYLERVSSFLSDRKKVTKQVFEFCCSTFNGLSLSQSEKTEWTQKRCQGFLKEKWSSVYKLERSVSRTQRSRNLFSVFACTNHVHHPPNRTWRARRELPVSSHGRGDRHSRRVCFTLQRSTQGTCLSRCRPNSIEF